MSGLAILAPAAQAPADLVAPRLPAPGGAHTAEAAKQFEAMMMAYMFQQMRQTVHPSGLFGNEGVARSTYDYLLDQAVTTRALQSGKGFGLAQRLEAEWDAHNVKKQGD